MVAPVLMKFGSEAQKKRFLPKIAAAEELWCQGYSEPGSGSDLASLRTKAERQGDHYIVNGQKIWTTNAHFADWIFCLVRTSNEGKRQEGISFLLIDMKSPGITLDPIYLVDGTRTPMRHEVNQVFFTDVKVPVENLVGEENKGWTYAKYLLEFERGGQAFGPRLRKAFRHLQTLSKTQMSEGEPLSADPSWREKMAAVEMEIDAIEMNELMFYSSLKTGDAPGNMGSVVKMRGTEVGQKVTELAVEAVGWYGTPFTELAQLRQQRRAGRWRVCRRRLAALLQHAQDDHLRRLVRSAAQRAGQGDARALTMDYRRLGRAGLKVSEICLGTMTFGNGADEAEAKRMVDAAFDAGVNFFDTANAYVGGVSETMLGKALKGRRSDAIVASKVFNPMGGRPNDSGHVSAAHPAGRRG